jgi:SAM-dependent methyltransferase
MINNTLLLLFFAIVVTSVELEKFIDCPASHLIKSYNLNASAIYSKENGFKWTNRTVQEFYDVIPPFITKLLTERKKEDFLKRVQILEIGCGDGHALGDFQYQYPRATVIGLNKGGYEYVQVETQDQWLFKRLKANYKIRCEKSSLKPSIPKITIMKHGVGMEPIPFPYGKFDFVFTMFSLDLGKKIIKIINIIIFTKK